ncbi:MAG: sugar phosphate nucleotidyltransferase [Bacteroidota bacterium]
MKPTLLILAAGMGSRYGSLKQMDGVGPANETIIDYSVYDAIRAGFGKVVFVIRESFATDFKAHVTIKFEGKIALDFVYQEMDAPVEGLDEIPHRLKPWGTAHAVLVAASAIQEPFAVINADDYYGSGAFQVIADFLTNAAAPDHYAMVGFVLKNTLSDHGSVSRGVCEMDADNYLQTVVERHKIQRDGAGVVNFELEGAKVPVSDESLVSMNFWGFHPNIFEETRKRFVTFVKENKDNPKSEFYIPLVVNDLLEKGEIKLSVLTSTDKWYGVTYKEDKPTVQSALKDLATAGQYPNPLW